MDKILEECIAGLESFVVSEAQCQEQRLLLARRQIKSLRRLVTCLFGLSLVLSVALSLLLVEWLAHPR